MRLPESFARKLILIANREMVPIGVFKSKQAKELLNLFLAEDVLQKVKAGNTFKVYANNREKLKNFLKERFGILDLNQYVLLLTNPDATKAETTQITSHSKTQNTKVYSGFFLRTYVDITARLNGEEFNLKTLNGCSWFISDYDHFHIPADVTIVGIENPETFYLIHRYRYLFPELKPLFLLRFNNKAFIQWLKSVPNLYLHFGDFDLSAIAIYILEYRKHLGAERCHYFIPDNIEALIAQSKNYSDYSKQLNDPRVEGLDFNKYPEVSRLASLINKYKKTLEQEALMDKGTR